MENIFKEHNGDLHVHRELRKLLEDATGESQHIIAIVLDIRGFTPFCEKVDSLDVATYIKKVYMRIIDGYFPEASFFKPTGDGLLVIIPFDEESLKATVNETIESCLNLLRDFRDLCSGDPMINFSTPEGIGIGIARGSACCLHSEKKILDYSGRVLNLASRLMNVARPAGIVIDSNFGLELLSEEVVDAFLEDSVYIRGIAEEEPIIVYCTREYTLIPESFKSPIREPRWEPIEQTVTMDFLKAMSAPWLRFDLKSKPSDEDKIYGEIRFRLVWGGQASIKRHYFDIEEGKMEYRKRAKNRWVQFKISHVLDLLEEDRLSGEQEVTFVVMYPVI